MLYALQGVLQYVSHQHLDPVTFNGLTQTKTLSAAFCCWLVLGTPQSPLQMIALAILFTSALVFQGFIGANVGIVSSSTSEQNQQQQQQTPSASKQPKSLPVPSHHATDWVSKGVVPCLGAAFLSGLAGALSQKGLQLTGSKGRDPFLYTVEISFYSAVTLVLHMLVRSRADRSSSSPGSHRIEWDKQRLYWNWKTLIPILVKAGGGVITALVHKYAGSVAKGFALMFGLVLSGTLQLTMTNESLQPYQVVGTLMIMLSTWMHFTHPPSM